MVLALIMECNNKSKSDYMYIKSTIDFLYSKMRLRLEPIYLGGKSRYKDCLKKINNIKVINDEPIHRIMFIDTDNEDNNFGDKKINDEIASWCSSNNIKLIYFKKDIESVYLRRVSKDKKKDAEEFVRKNLINGINLKYLRSSLPLRNGQSNFINVIEDILTTKQQKM